MSELERVSTGSTVLDEQAGEHEGVIVEAGDEPIVVAIPGKRRQAIIVRQGKSFIHKREDAAGRWVYEPL